jgi:glucose/mannose-6-phosphate isomerase
VTDARDFFGYKSSEDEPGRRPELEDEELAPPQLDEAITLDDPAVLKKIDPSDMLGRVLDLPRQLRQAARLAKRLELEERHREVDAVLVLAMGGSAIGAELVEAAAGERLRVPLVVHRAYGLPAWANERTLIVAASHSGATVETLSGAEEAIRRKLPLAVISTPRWARLAPASR